MQIFVHAENLKILSLKKDNESKEESRCFHIRNYSAGKRAYFSGSVEKDGTF
jgi:hypothetical protein